MRFDFEVEEAVTRDLVEHVVEKRHAGGKLLLAGAVQIELHTDLRFAGVANDFRNAHGVSLRLLRKWVQCSASFRAAIICAFSSADPTVKRTQFASNGCILLTFLIKTRDVSRVSKTRRHRARARAESCPRSGKPSAPGSAATALRQLRAFGAKFGGLGVEDVEVIEQEIGCRLRQHVDVVRRAHLVEFGDPRTPCPPVAQTDAREAELRHACASRRRCRTQRRAAASFSARTADTPRRSRPGSSLAAAITRSMSASS